jgi:hypothetical protein
LLAVRAVVKGEQAMRRTAVFLFVGSLIARAALADPILINQDFDDRSPGVQGFFERGLYLVTSFPGGIFNSVEIVASPDNPWSLPNHVRPALPGGAIEGRFLFADAPHATPATDLLFFGITGPRESAIPYRLSVFNRDGDLLGIASATITQGIGFHRREADIHSFLFEPGDPRHGLDDIRYTQPVIPEPGTLLLAASGLAMGYIRARHARRRRA